MGMAVWDFVIEAFSFCFIRGMMRCARILIPFYIYYALFRISIL